MKPDEYKKLRDAKFKKVKAKHEDDIIAGRTVYKSVGEETKRNKLQ